MTVRTDLEDHKAFWYALKDLKRLGMKINEKLLLISILIFLSGCDDSTPNSPKQTIANLRYRCLNGHVYILNTNGISPFYDNGEVKRCK